MQCRHLFRLYTGQVLHFFIFINHKNCLRITFFMFQWVSKMCNWLISQWLLITFQSSRRPWCNKKQTKFLSFYKKVVHFVSESGTPLRNFAEHLSIFCRTPFNIFAELLSYFFRTPLIIFEEHYYLMTWRTNQLFFSFDCSEVDVRYEVLCPKHTR